MAMSVAFAPMSTLHSDPLLNNFNDHAGSWATLSCGFETGLACIKTEPVSADDSMEDSLFASPSYAELTSAKLSHIKQGNTDLWQNNEDSSAFASWTYKHPEHWEAREVLDWLYTMADNENFDGAIFRGEAYNTVTGRQLCNMSLADFLSLDQNYGSRVHEIFQWLLQDANFKRPSPPETFKSETLGNVPTFLECPRNVTSSRQTHEQSLLANDKLNVFLGSNGNEMMVSVDGLGLYDIDISAITKESFDNISDSDYNSDHDVERSNSVSSDVFDDNCTDEDNTISLSALNLDLARKTHTPSSSSDSGCEEERRPTTRRRQTSTSKGNHLWEFVRDLLKDPRFNPSLLKWEDKELGVFKFVQSEAVAQMWGRKKNNPGMTYEKLSRAMRFCRSAGYFASVPKTGRFPKKLCFKFGLKAQSWRD
ncbi:ETS homologous factor-like [Littorina saxatilis]|uniref:Uncharacterized protein n=1 Tax=Littorina saxatilis TaxID=31220 RepID=A0AAN9G7T6_9CAEN